MREDIKERIDMISRGQVPEGYKKTKVGIIPEDWEVKRLGELGDFFRGRGIPKSEIISEGIGCITYGEIYTTYNYTFRSFKSYIDRATAKKGIEIKKNDILFTSSGETSEEIGKCVAYLGNEEAYAGGDIVIFRPHDTGNNGLDSEVFGYMLNHDITNHQKYRLGQGHSIVHIYAGNLKTILVPYLPKKEQQKIAQILSTWDKAIELKEKLIEEKRDQKKGLMQKLLTGQVRLPGFDGEWEEVRLGEVIKELNNRSITNNQYQVLSVTKDGIVLQSEYFNKQIASADNKGYKILEKGDLVFSAMNLWMGSVDILMNYEKGIVSPAYKVFKVDYSRIDISFFIDYVKSDRMIYLYNANSEQGASVVRRNLDLKGLLNSKIRIPIFDEQKAIGQILSTADKEIDLLSQKLDQLKNQKKGLMQLLLTGIVRVRA